ncbi:MAG: hypothetical protein R2825_15575 [Saprospiraceae bacterium]
MEIEQFFLDKLCQKGLSDKSGMNAFSKAAGFETPEFYRDSEIVCKSGFKTLAALLKINQFR